MCCGIVFWVTYQNNKNHYFESQTKNHEGYDGRSETVEFRCGTMSFGTTSPYFKSNCAACHDRSVVLVGPALIDFMPTMDKEWLIAFINNPDSLRKVKDKRYLKLKLKYKYFHHEHRVTPEKMTDEIATEIIKS